MKAPSTKLRTVMLVGPRLAGASDSTPLASSYAWAAQVQLAYRGADKDRTVADSTHGIRVILQSARPDAGPGTGQQGAGKFNVPFHSPQLLGMLAGPMSGFGPRLHFSIEPGVPLVRGGYDVLPAGAAGANSNGIAPLTVTPASRWPMPQDDDEIEVPWLALANGRLSVLVDAAAQPGSSPFGFLALLPDRDGKTVFAFVARGGPIDAEQLPHVRIDVQPSPGQARQRLVRLDLEPEGIAFDASILNPNASVSAGADQRIQVRLRLVQGFDPGDATRTLWSLKLIAPLSDSPGAARHYGEINRALSSMHSALAAAQRTLAVNLNASRPVPPVSWPLQPFKTEGRLALPTGTTTDPATWHMLVEPPSCSVSVAGARVEGGLPSTVTLGPDRVALRGYTNGARLEIHADQRPSPSSDVHAVPAAAGVDTIRGPRLRLAIAAGATAPTLALRAGAPGQARLRWFFDEHGLAQESAARYAKAQVQPARQSHTWTFMPVRGGWLQWPLPLQGAITTADGFGAGLEAPAARLDGELEFTIGAADPKAAQAAPALPMGRRLIVSGADYVVATASFSMAPPPRTDAVLQEAVLDFYGADGKTNGILWHATSSPSPEQILPGLDAGPMALSTPWLGFGRDTVPRRGMRILESGTYEPLSLNAGAVVFKLNLGVTGAGAGDAERAVAWQGIRGIPTVTAVPMTRTSAGRGAPMSTRHLLPGQIEGTASVTLAFEPASWLPMLGVERGGVEETSLDGSALPLPLLGAAAWTSEGVGNAAWPGVPLVAVTLPGIEMKPKLSPFAELETRLRYDLPILDELFTTAHLPESGHGAADKASGAPPPEPLPTALDLDGLRLAWDRARDRLLLSRTQDAVVGRTWLKQADGPLEVAELFAGTTWHARFALHTDELPEGDLLGLGSYEMAPAGAPATEADRYAADKALAGLTANFTVNGIELVRADSAPLPGAAVAAPLGVTGFAAALWPTAPEGDPNRAWRDTRGALTSPLPDAGLGASLVVRRAGRVLGAASQQWLRATLRQPLPVTAGEAQPGSAARKLAFWFCDLPLARLAPPLKDFDAAFSEVLAFRPTPAGPAGKPEIAAGPSQQAFDADVLPGATYEWRFANDPAPADFGPEPLADAALYDIDLGALRFRPLRLLDVTLARPAAGKPFHIARAIVLGTLARDLDASRLAGGFGPDRAYDSANAVAVQLKPGTANNTDLSFVNATWHAAQAGADPRYPWGYRNQPGNAPIRFHLPEVEVAFTGCAGASDAPPDWNRSAVWVELELSGGSDAGRPRFTDDTAKLWLTLFGRPCQFAKGKVETLAEGDLTVTFSFAATAPASGVSLSQVVLSRLALVTPADGGAPAPAASALLTLSGSLQAIWTGADEPGLATADIAPLSLVAFEFGGAGLPAATLRWLNHVQQAFTVDVDHARGLVRIDAPAGQPPPARIEPIAGMQMDLTSFEARLRLVVAEWKGLEPCADGRFPAASAFGELVASNNAGKDGHAAPPPVAAPAGPRGQLAISAFRHQLVLAGPDGPHLASRISVTLDCEPESRICWPTESVPLFDFAKLARTVGGHGEPLTMLGAGAALVHTLRIRLDDAPMPTSCLSPIGKPRPGAAIALERPWNLHALVQHTVSPPGQKAAPQRMLRWTCLDHIVVAGARALAEGARRDERLPTSGTDRRAHAFAARYRRARDYPASNLAASDAFVKGGIGLRSHALAGFPVAALARRLIEGVKFDADGRVQGDWIESWVVNGAGPVTVLSTDAQHTGVLLSLPWICVLDHFDPLGQRDSKLAPLGPFMQAGTAKREWTAPDIDWVAGVPMKISTEPPSTLAVSTYDAAELQRAVSAALDAGATGSGDDDVHPAALALMPVEQVFLRARKDEKPAPVEETPFWLRSLLALAYVWEQRSLAPPDELQQHVRALLVSGKADGRFCKVLLKLPGETAQAAWAGCPPQAGLPAAAAPPILHGLGRSGLGNEVLLAGDMPTARESGAGRARLRGIAEGLIADPVIAIAVWREVRSLGWMEVAFAADQDDPGLRVRPPRLRVPIGLFASPSLGWPTAAGTELAAAASLGMGDDRPFQDLGPAVPPAPPAPGALPDIATYGSGFSGRVASLSLPHQAYAEDGGQPAVYYALGRKTIFERPTGLPLSCPPARHLTASNARVIAPRQQELAEALRRVTNGNVAAIVAPFLERSTFGLRPGAMQAEFDSLVIAEPRSAIAFDSGNPWLGRAAHGGPLLFRQVRPPRSVALPRVPLQGDFQNPASRPVFETHGRRTFVALDDSSGAPGWQAVPFRWFSGIATVLRMRGSAGDASVHLRMNDPVLWADMSTEDASIQLRAGSPSLNGTALVAHLMEMGLIAVPDAKRKDLAAVSLVVDDVPSRFLIGEWRVQKSSVFLRLSGMPESRARELRERLRAADGDTCVRLSIVCARQENYDPKPAEEGKFPLRGEQSGTDSELQPETRRSIVLPVLVRQSASPSVGVQAATLVFADPSYDRALSGPGSSDVQRDKDGVAWKFAADRIEYGLDTPIYFAFGALVDGSAAPGQPPGTFRRSATAIQGELALSLISRQFNGSTTTAPVRIADCVPKDPRAAQPLYAINASEAYSIPLERLRAALPDGKDGPLLLEDGDELSLAVTFEPAPGSAARNLAIRARLVRRPIVPPPPAVYSLVCPDTIQGVPAAARVLLHATNPLPQSIAFVNLLDDLALGHIRRLALFTWQAVVTPDVSLDRATLVKVDRSGGGQLPATASDFRTLDPLPP